MRLYFHLSIVLLSVFFISCRSSKPFELVLLPDTQNYSYSHPEIFKAQTNWVAANAHRFAYVLHQGDITDRNSEVEWQRAGEYMSMLDGKVPVTFVAGNHDMGSRPGVFSDTRETVLFNKYFSYEKYSRMKGFGGTFEVGKMDNTWHTFKAGGLKWLILSLEFGPRNSVLDWAAAVIESHPGHKIILNTHAYLYSDSKRMSLQHRWLPQAFGVGKMAGQETANDGELIWEKLLKPYPNVLLVFCGHVLNGGTGLLESKGANGNTVYQMLANYQLGVKGSEKGGNGYLRTVKINPRKNTIKVETYSPYINTFKTDHTQQFEFTDVDFKTPPVTVPVMPAEIDRLVNDYVKKYQVPGLSLAIAKEGKVLYEKGYGMADSAKGESVTPFHKFRIASISKPVTAITILKLAEAGKLNLDAKVFGEGAVLGTMYGKLPYGKGISDITIRQLLQHTSGGWRNDGKDPMFRNASLSNNELISWTLDHDPLVDMPGTKYAYSNFGYCILGAVIEKITGKKYEAYVTNTILQPMGIPYMRVGGNTLAERMPDEVVYYGQNGDNPYLYNISRMNSHGGWIASATDLVKLMGYVDGFKGVPDILNAEFMKEMTGIKLSGSNYACGFRVLDDGSWMHSGALPGTGSTLIRFPNGYAVAVIVNSRTTGRFFPDLDRLASDIAKQAVQ